MAAGAVAYAWPGTAQPKSPGLGPVLLEVERRHDEAVQRLQEWIRQPSIAAENKGMSEGCELLIRLLRDAGFDSALRVPTDGQPGVFATLDAGAKRTVGIYFMYDVKQVDPAEWSSPPWDAAFVDKPGFGKAIVGRGAVNQKGPEAALLAALHAFRGAGRKLPVNLVLIAEGEEEIGSPNFAQIVRRPEVQSALARTTGVFMPSASQSGDGVVLVTLGAKGIVELELTSTGERWGRGPRQDIHSSNKARVDSPAWHLVHALHTLVTPEGEPAIDGFADRARPISAAEKAMVAEGARRFDEAVLKKQMGVQRWIKDVGFLESLERLVSQPTVNIEGLVGGYTGPGGKTILPHKAALKRQLAKRGFGDVEARMTGGYDPTSTAADAALIRAQIGVYRRAGIEPVVWPRNAGSWPGYVFTGEPLLLPAGHFGLGHGGGAHAPDEYYVIESTNPKVQGFDGAVRSFVEYLQELAVVS
jgi:acetylornithine deacetylase/succinyl-diaminopimelate desuccinylase-like protein